MLYPRESASRELKDLSGIWRFKTDSAGRGLTDKWFLSALTDTIPMPVPSSYNDITQDISLRDFIGDVFYETSFHVSPHWQEKKILLRFGSATHKAVVFLNGREVIRHQGGFLPFEADVSAFVDYGNENRLTVCVNNVLDWSCIPPGELKKLNDADHPEAYQVQETYFDFFNYAGLHRKVWLYAVPSKGIEDIRVETAYENGQGRLDYQIRAAAESQVTVVLLDANGIKVAQATGASGHLNIADAEAWEPGHPYLYRFQVATSTPGSADDVYALPVGLRSIRVTHKQFLLNGKPFYFRGFGKHEDSDFRGRGYDAVTMVKDFNLLHWLGANSFRTSHYPYAEEVMNFADEQGIVIIDEVPAVGMHFFTGDRQVFTQDRVNDKTLANHIQAIKELIARDRNHPCVVMWCLANEAATYEAACLPYFEKVVQTARELDPQRPITITHSPVKEECKVAHLFDVLCLNRYYSWYSDSGHLELVEMQALKSLAYWAQRWNKPLLMSEFGADSIAGLHADPPVMFSEEYQVELIRTMLKALDACDHVVGEHVWNFADFATKQGITRIMGNRKGVLTRQRQPKMAAHFLKQRWHEIKDREEQQHREKD